MKFDELLKAQNLTDEQIAAILAGMKENKIYTAGEENLDIRYGKLKTDFENLTAQHNESTTLIEQLQKDNAGNAELQSKIADYQTQITDLQDQLKSAQIESEVKVALLEAKASDIDYMIYKLKEKGDLEIDDKGNVKGIADKIAGLKTQFPNQFEAEGSKKIEENKLPKGNDEHGSEPKSLEEALKMQYEKEK